MILRLLIACSLFLGVIAPAGADDIGATARSVVRVATIAVVDDRVVGFGHGSGFAIAPNRIVTNAHVVELADRYPDNVVIGIVPSEGDKSYQGKVVAYDARRDLALIEFKGAPLPPATLYTGPVTEGDPSVALGYPGNVDLATVQSAADYIRPTSPVRSEGVFSGRRSLTGSEVLLHTASIARGSSGGPLLDRCGRVIGVNSAITRGEDGDAPFGFAIADTELAAFLRDAGQPYAAIGTPCTSIEERLRADSAAELRASEDAAGERRAAAAAAQIAREEQIARARIDAGRARENVMALAALLLVGGALVIGAAGLFESRGRREPAIWLGIGGGAAVLASVIVFICRPSGDIMLPANAAMTVPTRPDGNRALGTLACAIDPDRSRVILSSTSDVTLNWGKRGCANGGVQFADEGARWERMVVPDDDQTVSLLSFDPATLRYSNTRYLMSAAGMAAARAARGQAAPARCDANPAAAAALAERQSAIRATLPPLPNEKLVYACRPAGRMTGS